MHFFFWRLRSIYASSLNWFFRLFDWLLSREDKMAANWMIKMEAQGGEGNVLCIVKIDVGTLADKYGLSR